VQQLGSTELFNSEVKVHYNDLRRAISRWRRLDRHYNDAQNFSILWTATGALNYAGYASPGSTG
jgi:hypothetical protein